MSYTCTDFTDDVVNAFVDHGLINDDDVPDDDPSAQADLVFEALNKLIKQRDDLLSTLKELVAWAQHMGGWDAPCWQRAAAIVEYIETDAKDVTKETAAGAVRPINLPDVVAPERCPKCGNERLHIEAVTFVDFCRGKPDRFNRAVLDYVSVKDGSLAMCRNCENVFPVGSENGSKAENHDRR